MGNLIAIEAKDKDANGGREVAVLPIRIDYRNEFCQRRVARTRNLLQRAPERLLKANACSAAGNVYRPLDNCRLHGASSDVTNNLGVLREWRFDKDQ
jgi:hypothetical protein